MKHRYVKKGWILLAISLIHLICQGQSNVPYATGSFGDEIDQVYFADPSPYHLFTSISQTGESRLFIFAPNGEALYYKYVDDFVYNFQLHVDGRLSYFVHELGAFIIMDSLFRHVDTLRTPGYSTDYHVLEFQEDGSCFLIGKDIRIMDMSQIIEGGDTSATVVGNIVQKLDKDKNPVFEWNTFDHFEITDSYNDILHGHVDYAHINTVELDTDSTIILSSRNMSELTKVNLKSGEIIWRMGGKNNQFTFRNFDRPFSGQHAIRRKEDQTFTLYDNGILANPKLSRGMAFTIDEDSLIAEQTQVFSYNPDLYTRVMGNTQNLDNGNTLISWGGYAFTEFDADALAVHHGVFRNAVIPAYGVYKYTWEQKALTVDQVELDFGVVEAGDSVSKELELYNLLGDTLVLDEFIVGKEEFSVQDESVLILPGDTARLRVVFTSPGEGTIEDTLTIMSHGQNEGLGLQLILKGQGTGQIQSFERQRKGQTVFYPVPFGEFIHFRSDKQIESIHIHSIDGKKRLSTVDQGQTGTINTQGLEPGPYLILIRYSDQSAERSLCIRY